VWRTPAGLHVAFEALYETDHPLGLPNTFVRRAIVVETFDPVMSAPLDLRVFDDVYPPELAQDDHGANGVAAGPDGRFLLTYRWFDPVTGVTAERALVADVDDPDFQVEVSLLEGTTPQPLVSQSAWDGEAFVVHAYDTEVHSLRVDLEGEVVQPLKAFGSGMGVGFGELAHRVSTNAVSGNSFVMNSHRIAAHGRDGEPLSWIPAQGYKEFSFREGSGSIPRARVAPDDAGRAWLLWTEDLAESLGGPYAGVMHIGSNGEPDVHEEFVLENGEIPTYFAPLARRDGSAWLAIGDEAAIFARTVVGGELGDFARVFDGSTAPVRTIGPLELSALEWEDETWLSFAENRSDIAHTPQALRVEPGCVYPALPAP
jgi:hypothetical protein